MLHESNITSSHTANDPQAILLRIQYYNTRPRLRHRHVGTVNLLAHTLKYTPFPRPAQQSFFKTISKIKNIFMNSRVTL